MLLKKFFTAHEAAQWLCRESRETMQADDIHRLAESGDLPICFGFRGNLGVFDKPAASSNVAQSVMQAAFTPAKRKAYFPGCYLRAATGASLGVAVENLRGKVTKVDALNVGPVTVAQPGRGFGSIDFDPNTEVLWRLDGSGRRVMGRSIASSDWLFQVDDLAKLASTRARPPVSAAESVSLPGSDFAMKRAALIAKHRHAWPTIAADLTDATRNGLRKAKAGARGWNESMALNWARSKGKLKSASTEANCLDAAMRSMSDLPSTTHVLGL